MKLSLDEARTLIEVGEDATPEEIKTKYKRLALKWCEGITCRASKCMIDSHRLSGGRVASSPIVAST